MQLSTTLEPGWCWTLRTLIWQRLSSWRCLKAFGIRNMFHTVAIIAQVAVLVLNGGAMIGISVTALMDINVMLVQVNISVFVQFPNISVSLKRPTWLKTMEQIFRPSESLRWLTGSQRSTATPLLDWSWTPSRATSTCREPDSPTPPGDQVAAGLKIRFIICPHPRPNVSILRSLGLNIQPGEKVTICHFFTFYSNITVQRTPFLFRMYDLWVRGSCSEILMCFDGESFSQGYLGISWCPIYQDCNPKWIWYDMTSTYLGCTCRSVWVRKINSDPTHPGLSLIIL